LNKKLFPTSTGSMVATLSAWHSSQGAANIDRVLVGWGNAGLQSPVAAVLLLYAQFKLAFHACKDPHSTKHILAHF
jgi:hypothetical protein